MTDTTITEGPQPADRILTAPRCRCNHPHAAHAGAGFDDGPCYVGAYRSRPELTCSCRGYSPAPPPWRVSRDAVDALTVSVAGPWAITTPRGVELFRAWSQPAAAELAVSLASIEEMLARVARLERNAFGNHPSLKAAARPGALFVLPEPADDDEVTLVEGEPAPDGLPVIPRVCCPSAIPGPHVAGCDFEPRGPLDYSGPVVVVEP